MADSTWWAKRPASGERRTPVQKAPLSLGIPLGVMTAKPRASTPIRSPAVCMATLCVAVGLAQPVQAGPVESRREGLFGHRPADGRQFPAPPIARYVTEDGDVFT